MCSSVMSGLIKEPHNESSSEVGNLMDKRGGLVDSSCLVLSTERRRLEEGAVEAGRSKSGRRGGVSTSAGLGLWVRCEDDGLFWSKTAVHLRCDGLTGGDRGSSTTSVVP